MKQALAILLTLTLLFSLVACAGGGNSSSAPAPSSAPASPAAPASSAPASSAAPKEPVKLEYWFEGAGPERTPTHEAIIKGFNDLNNGITVEGIYVDLTNGLEKVNTSFAGGMLPDVIYAQDSWKSAMVAQNMVVQLDDRFNAWDEKDQFSESALVRDRNMDMQGRLFFIPCATNITGIWYRKDVFKEKGFEAPTTWDNFFKAVEGLSDPKAGVYGHTLRGGAGSTNQMVNAIIAYVGMEDYWSADGKAQILRSKEAEDIVNKYKDIFQKQWTPESGLTAGFNEMVADFNAGIAMTLIHNLGSYENQRKTFQPDQYGFYPFPPSLKGKYVEQVPSVKGLCITVNSKHPDEAWEYVKWNASHEAVSAINEAVGELPTRIDSANDDWVKNAPHMSNLPAYSAAPKGSVLLPNYLPDYNSINKNYAEPTFQEVLTGKTTARAFLDGWADQLEKAYAEYQAQKAKK